MSSDLSVKPRFPLNPYLARSKCEVVEGMMGMTYMAFCKWVLLLIQKWATVENLSAYSKIVVDGH
jgi:hypothetical protein